MFGLAGGGQSKKSRRAKCGMLFAHGLWLACVRSELNPVFCRNSSRFRSSVVQSPIDVLVASMGGVSTTFLMLGLWETGLITNSRVDNDGLKHLAAPPKSDRVQRAIFVFGDLVHAMASLFRRQLHRAHALKMSKGRCLIPIEMSLDAYLLGAVDAFRFEAQLRSWLNATASYDIMFVRYPKFFEHTEKICSFVQRPQTCLSRTQRRLTRMANLSRESVLAFRTMYGNLADFMATLPDVFVKPASSAAVRQTTAAARMWLQLF